MIDMVFKKENDMLTHLKKITDSQRIVVMKVGSGRYEQHGANPIYIEGYKTDFGLNIDSELFTTINEQGNGCFHVFTDPQTGKEVVKPVAPIAKKSIASRRGLSGTAIDEDFTIVNRGSILRKFGDHLAQTLLQGDLEIAQHSQQYQWIPQHAVAESFIKIVKSEFTDVVFFGGFYSLEETVIALQINDLSESLKKRGINGAMGLLLINSDTGDRAIRVHPIIIKDNQCIRIGSPYTMPHIKGASLFVFNTALTNKETGIKAMLTQSFEGIDKLFNIEIKHPKECFYNAGFFAKLPEKYLNEVWECNSNDIKGKKVNAFEIFMYLWKIPEHIRETMSDELGALHSEEKLYRLLNKKWSSFDLDFVYGS